MRSSGRGVPLGFETIVVATDFSPFAERALLKAVEMARSLQSRVILAHVIDPLFYSNSLNGAPFVPRQIEQNAKARLEMAASLLRRERIPYELVVREGMIRDALCDLVEEYGASLLVIGTHGESRFDRDVVGSVAEKILRVAPCPVMTVGSNAMPSIPLGTKSPRLLFATGFSTHSIGALPFADAMAHYLGAELHLLHVALPAADRPESVRRAMEKLEQMARTQVQLTQRVHCLVQHGQLGETIASVAASIGAVAIVLAVQQEDLRRKPVGGLHQGLIYRIVTQTCCPVITLHSGLDRESLRASVLGEALLS
ncbi:MAG TPA: universal stress protein [Acidisarcina sp.]|nr:universal stress protein [Acidisarcina sp.]